MELFNGFRPKEKKKRSLTHSITIFLTLLALTFSTVGVTPAYAATFTVTTTSNNGAGSLRQALADAPSGSTTPSMTTIYLAAPLDIVKKVKIDGSTLSSKTTINGTPEVGVFTNSAGTLGDSVKLDSLIITMGSVCTEGYRYLPTVGTTLARSHLH